jgi:hypothetical protein
MGLKEALLEFLNDPNEVHSLWFGFIDAILISKAGSPYAPEALAEPHYYLLGGLVGKIVSFGVFAWVCWLIFT